MAVTGVINAIPIALTVAVPLCGIPWEIAYIGDIVSGVRHETNNRWQVDLLHVRVGKVAGQTIGRCDWGGGCDIFLTKPLCARCVKRSVKLGFYFAGPSNWVSSGPAQLPGRAVNKPTGSSYWVNQLAR